jgi:hypothetical protein
MTDSMMSETMISAAILIHIGAVFYIVGFLVRDELLLRILILAGTFLYISYYFLFPEAPLWDAIITSLIMAAANIWVLIRIIFERTKFALSEEEVELFEAFDTLTPGQFRRALKRAVWHTAAGGELLCLEGQKATRLFYVLNGSVKITKGDKVFEVSGSNFIGEVAFVLEGTFSATVEAKPGLRYIEWVSDDLKKQMRKNMAYNNALIALFNRDLASKLATSHQS